jgi:uncharacterized protein YunC (DUF1805 family)
MELYMTTENLHYPLKKPLLIMPVAKGFLACGYINPETCNATEEACAIVRGVNNYDDMKQASVVAVSNKAKELGDEIGDTGEEALQKMC